MVFLGREGQGPTDHWQTFSKVSVKRGLLQCQKRPTIVSKETYYRVREGQGPTDHWQTFSKVSAQVYSV